MPAHKHIRTLAAGAVLVTAVVVGLADWEGSTDGGYVVRSGDSLWSIAQAHSTTVAQLAAANNLDPNDILPIGIHLRLPGQGAVLTAATSHRPGPVSAKSAWAWCAAFTPTYGPYGVLPDPLAGSATYARLSPIFEHWANYYGLSLSLLEAVAWQESGWQQDVVSPTGAVGVGQIEPYTARFIVQDLVGQPLDIHSLSDNIRMSAAFLNYLARREGDNRCATIAAYYEGPVNLQHRGVLPDTQQYVADVEALVTRFE